MLTKFPQSKIFLPEIYSKLRIHLPFPLCFKFLCILYYSPALMRISITERIRSQCNHNPNHNQRISQIISSTQSWIKLWEERCVEARVILSCCNHMSSLHNPLQSHYNRTQCHSKTHKNQNVSIPWVTNSKMHLLYQKKLFYPDTGEQPCSVCNLTMHTASKLIQVQNETYKVFAVSIVNFVSYWPRFRKWGIFITIWDSKIAANQKVSYDITIIMWSSSIWLAVNH